MLTNKIYHHPLEFLIIAIFITEFQLNRVFTRGEHSVITECPNHRKNHWHKQFFQNNHVASSYQPNIAKCLI